MTEIEVKVQKIVYFSNDREFVIKEMYKYITGLLDKVVPEKIDERNYVYGEKMAIAQNMMRYKMNQNIAKLKEGK